MFIGGGGVEVSGTGGTCGGGGIDDAGPGWLLPR